MYWCITAVLNSVACPLREGSANQPSVCCRICHVWNSLRNLSVWTDVPFCRRTCPAAHLPVDLANPSTAVTGFGSVTHNTNTRVPTNEELGAEQEPSRLARSMITHLTQFSRQGLALQDRWLFSTWGACWGMPYNQIRLGFNFIKLSFNLFSIWKQIFLPGLSVWILT